MAVSGARAGAATRLRQLAARALARDLAAFVAPDPATARALGLDLAAAGLRLVATPRHAAVLVLVGDLPEGLRRAAAVVYAQMPRPRAILAIGAGALAPLPDPDVAVPAAQDALGRGVGVLRGLLANAAFSPGAAAFDVAAVRTERRYTCPMHPEIVRDAPGKCPICGMNLIPQEEAGGQMAHEGMGMEHAQGAGHGAMSGASAGDTGAGYTCPMHPEVISAVPGSCPICGMDLVPRAAGGTDTAVATGSQAVAGQGGYTCPMHPEIVRDEAGSCPICGMDLVPRAAGDGPGVAVPEGGAAAGQGGYTCPMHPEIVQAGPGSCPICGMDLVPREPPAASPSHDRAGDGAAAAMPGGYTCPMHPEVSSDGPGACPICGMDLVPREEAGGGHAPPRDPHADHRAMSAGDAPRPGGATAPGHAGNDPPSGGAVNGRAADGAASHGDHALAAAGPGDRDHGEMGHGGMPASAAPAAATRHGAAAHGPHAMGGATEPPGGPDPAAHAMAEMDHRTHNMGGSGGMGHGDHEMAAMGSMGHGSHDMGDMGHDMGDMAGMDHSAHAMGGFMSMVALTRDLPRSRDGLPMEWVEAPFGPLFPGLPGGLALALTLDGDVVARAARAAGAAQRGLAASWPGPLATFPDRLARLDPLAAVAYRQLAWRALEAAAGRAAGEREALARIGALERERAASHLGWLAGFADLLGLPWLAGRAADLQLAVARADEPGALAPLREAARRLAERAGRMPTLRRRLSGIGRLEGEVGARRGPVARAAGTAVDERAADPAYRALGFAPTVRDGDDAHARLLVRLAEIEQGLALALAAGTWQAAGPQLSPAADGGGHGMAALETPRGAATLHLMLDGATVREAHLDTPSGAHAPLVAAVAEGRELADALVGVASLDLSPWELDR